MFINGRFLCQAVTALPFKFVIVGKRNDKIFKSVSDLDVKGATRAHDPLLTLASRYCLIYCYHYRIWTRIVIEVRMKTGSAASIITLILALVAIGDAQPAHGQIDYNVFGIYTAQDTDPSGTSYWGPPTMVTLYVIVGNPRNFHFGAPSSTAETDITAVGGFEFKVVLPAEVFMFEAVLPPNTTNYHPGVGNFMCGTNLPVIDALAVCVTLNVGAFTQTAGGAYLRPVDSWPSIPGSLAVMDHDDEYRLNKAYPSSPTIDDPVFGFWQDVELFAWVPDWTIRLAALGDGGNVLGAGRFASDGFDPRLETMIDPSTRVTFRRLGWNVADGAYQYDFKAPYDPLVDTRSWLFTLNVPSYLIGRPATITFEPSFPSPGGPALLLTDHSIQRLTSVTGALAYTFIPDAAVREFTLSVGPDGASGIDDTVPFTGYALAAHPNPFNPQTAVTFALPREGRAEVRVYSVRGELVAVLGGTTLPAGPQEFPWRGTDRAGRAVPSGMYFARLLVDNRYVGETLKMSLVR